MGGWGDGSGHGGPSWKWLAVMALAIVGSLCAALWGGHEGRIQALETHDRDHHAKILSQDERLKAIDGNIQMLLKSFGLKPIKTEGE